MTKLNSVNALDRIAGVVFLLACLIAAFLFGVVTARRESFPFGALQSANRTIQSFLQRTGQAQYAGDLVAPAPTGAPLIQSFEGADPQQRFLLAGGRNQFVSSCPELGCAAVEVDDSGAVVRAWPWRPVEIAAANSTPEYRYEAMGFDPVQSLRIASARMLPDGDLILGLARTDNAQLFPFGAGVARIGPDGKPRWYRRDYSHHWQTLTPDGEIITPAMEIGRGPIQVERGRSNGPMTLRCREPYLDTLRVMDGSGKVVLEHRVLGALLKSEFRGALREPPDQCDPTHLNFVDVLRPSAAGAIPGAQPGDFVVSLRDPSLFAIIGRRDGEVKMIRRGSFRAQHSVHHLDGSKFLMIDNLGGTLGGEGARLLEVDVATGAERTIFPTEKHAAWLEDAVTPYHGYLSISADRQRAVAVFSRRGAAFEIRLSDGAVLRRFENTHTLAGRPRRFEMVGVDFIEGASSPAQ